MNGSLLEAGLIDNCAPTLAGMKVACLFNYFFETRQSVLQELKSVNEMLNERGVFVEALLWRETSVLIYTYRPALLEEKLKQHEIMELLVRYGYVDSDVSNCINHLKERLYNYKCFPHEIGIFLGYPLEDVKGFIENNGKNCKSCGVWKVYHNEVEKQKLFDKFKKCTQVYKQVFGEGRKLVQMTVLT